MNFENPVTVYYFVETMGKHDIAIKNVKIINGKNIDINGINLINSMQNKNVVFIDRIKYASNFFQSPYARDSLAIISDNAYLRQRLTDKNINHVVCDDPFTVFSQIIDIFFMPKKQDPAMLRQSSDGFYYTGHNVAIGENTQIGKNVVIEDNVTIGQNCIIGHSTFIGKECHIENNVTIGDNSTIGVEPFYCKLYDKKYFFMTSVGNVHLQDNVVIGSNCVIERGITSTTFVSKYSTIGHQVIIGHDSIIGESNLVLPQAGLSGHVRTGSNVTVRGKGGVDRGITIGKNSVIHGQSAATRNVPDDANIFGSRGLEQSAYVEQLSNIKNLAQFFDNKQNSSDIKHVQNDDFSRRIFDIVAKYSNPSLEYSPDKLKLNVSDAFSADSLDKLEMAMDLENEFDCELDDEEIEIIASLTISELMEFIRNKMLQ